MSATTDIVTVGDVGTLIRVPVVDGAGNPLDLSAASVARLKVTFRDGTTAVWDATVNGSYLEYTTTADTILVPGRAEVRPYVEIPNWSGHGLPVPMIIGSL